MKHISSCLSILVLSAVLSSFSMYAQATEQATGTRGDGISAAIPSGEAGAINVVSYGARGDGHVDDTAAINSAMSACIARTLPHNGCVLYFPAGVYITTGLTLRSYVNMKGDGWGTSVLLLKPHTASDVLTVPVDAFNFSISGLTLDGNSGRGGTGNCFFVAPAPLSPAEWNTANKRTAPVNAQKWGHIEEVMFSHCSMDGIHINAFNYMLFFDNFYVFDNGVYGLYTEGTNSGFTNFQIERNGTAGIHLAGSNDRFTSGEVIWNGATVGTEAAVYVSGGRNIITAVETEDSYTNGFFDKGSDNVFMGCVSDSNGYVPKNTNASSRAASGFVIAGSGSVYIGDKVSSYRGRLPDGNFTTEWPYSLESRNNGKIDITYDSTNKPPRTH